VDDPLRAQAAAYYRTKLEEHGPGPRGMDWKDADSQGLRFDVIARRIEWSGTPSVLDVGCGDGELLAHLRRLGRAVEYHGVDIVPEMVERCDARFGRGTAEVATVEEVVASGRRFDWVVASGTFNVKSDVDEATWRAHVHGSIRAMFAACRRGVVFNIMSAFVERRYDRLYYATPDELAGLAVAHLSRRFVIDHSYPLFELTMAVLRDG
jgi:SAM-dependent methyltransferase